MGRWELGQENSPYKLEYHFSSKENGGLGIRNLSSLNMSLLGKWVWRFLVEDNST